MLRGAFHSIRSKTTPHLPLLKKSLNVQPLLASNGDPCFNLPNAEHTDLPHPGCRALSSHFSTAEDEEG